ncbi:uncharacterized protein TrAtP1_000271 [Trichoderma atroviride]|uniref:uncharacterized protein n=1 Tax=Hypocrea atroviridis TaxID=63577 RepID=UPI003319744C|nr:hypothetical protein TrAtP1_000271 [Trichoderma atroviride]
MSAVAFACAMEQPSNSTLSQPAHLAPSPNRRDSRFPMGLYCSKRGVTLAS